MVLLSAIFPSKLCHYIPQIDLQWEVISFYSPTALWEKGRKNLSHKEQHNGFQAELSNIHICGCRSADACTSNLKSALWEDGYVYSVEEISSRFSGESKAFGQMKKNSKKSSFQAENLTSDAESVAEAKHYLRVKTMPHCQTQHSQIGTLHLFEKCFQYWPDFFFFSPP